MLMDKNTNDHSMDKLVRILGGLKNMEDNYPEIYKAYLRTNDALEKNLELSPNISSVDFFIAGIGYEDDTKTKIYLDYYAICSDDSNDTCDAKLLSLQAVRKSDKKPLSPENNDMTFQGDLKIKRLVITVENESLNAIELVPDFYGISSQIDSFNCYAHLDTYDFDASASFVINHPNHQKTPEGTPINIEYHKRYHFREEDCDYFYNDDAIGGNYYTGFFTLDNDGSFSVQNAQVREISSKKLDYWVNGNFAPHPFGEGSVTLQDNTIRWTLTPRTDTRLNAFLPYTQKVSLEYNMTYDLLLTNGKRAAFRITNDPDVKKSPSVEKIDPIDLFCDCLLKGAGITMEDGSTRKIETLTVGERVKTGPSSSAAIKMVGGGTNTVPVVTIKAENGSSVKMSYSHTIVTGKGLRHSQLVQAGDTLFTSDNSETKATSVEVSAALVCELYYIELDCVNGRLYIDGIQAGDSAAALTGTEQYTNKYYSLPENWRKDFESWNAPAKPKQPLNPRPGLNMPKYSADNSRENDTTIEQVSALEDVDTFTYEAFINTMRGRSAELVLCKSYSDTYEDRIKAKSEWFYTFGSVTVKKSLLEPQKELFIYLYDTDLNCRISNIVPVFSAPLTVKKWVIDQESITFSLDRSIWNYPIATGLLISHPDEQSPIQLISENISELPSTRFALEELDCSRDTEKFEFDARLVIDMDGVCVYGAPTETLTAFIAPPQVRSIAYQGKTLTARGRFLSGADVCAGLYAGDVFVTELDALSENSGVNTRVFSIDGASLTHDGVFSVRFFYKTGLGESLKTECFPIVTAAPRVMGFRTHKGRLILMFGEKSDYELCWNADGGDAKVTRTYGNEAVIPDGVYKLTAAVVSGVSKGRAVTITLPPDEGNVEQVI